MTRCTLLLALVLTLLMRMAVAQEDILIADFEGDDYGAWTTTGTAFGSGPARGTLPGQMRVGGYLGKGLVNSFHGGDASLGRLMSPFFKIERNYINFLIGGGGHAGKTCMNLLLDGTIVRTAHGTNTAPGGSETLRWQSWDVAEFIGQQVQIQIVDDHTGGWGHINVDHIVQSNEKVFSERTRKIIVESRFLNLPVQNRAPKTWMRLLRDDAILREFDIELAASPGETDFWVTLELSEYMGETLILRADNIAPRSQGFDMITQADGIIGGEDLYREKYRPQFHFSAKRGWLNDPNGLVYYDGEYHLFFQHNPYGWNWGNMTWGHAVSGDLVHWEELGDALHPDEFGTIFSGSAVVDWHNTTGFQTGERPPLVAIYTYAGGSNPWSKEAKHTQGIAYSNDRGRSWMKYEGNPVQEHIIGGNRDPKVIWHEPSNQWVIVLFLDKTQMALFTSKDLKTWRKTQELEAFFECPELFALPVDGDHERIKWVLYGASGAYFTGDFDGETFTPDGDAISFNYGDCFYASQTFNDIPPEDGRRIQIAWGRTGHPDMPFNQMMNFPVVLNLRQTDAGPRLFSWPVREIETLYRQSHTLEGLSLDEANHALESVKGNLLDVTIVFEPSDNAAVFGVTVQGLTIICDLERQELRCKDKTAPLRCEKGRVSLRLLVDRLSVEIFAKGGQVYMPMSHVGDPAGTELQLFATEGQVAIAALTVHELASAWR